MPATNVDPFLFEEVAQHPAARERELKMQLVHSAHDGQIGCGHRSGPVVDAAAADPKCLGLLGDRQIMPPYGSQGPLLFESRRVVPAGSSAHRLSCSAAILAAVRQRLHLSNLFKNPEPALLRSWWPLGGRRILGDPTPPNRSVRAVPRHHPLSPPISAS